MKKKYKIIIIFFTVAVMILGSGITYSIFHSDSRMTPVDQGIAKFIFNTESLDNLQISLYDLHPGDDRDYPFSISNNSNDHFSSVAVQYQLTLKTYHFVPLTIELYKINSDDEEELIFTCNEENEKSFTRNDQNELIFNTPVQEMAHSQKQLDNYKLKVTFPNKFNEAVYSNLVDYINIEIKSWQKLGEKDDEYAQE